MKVTEKEQARSGIWGLVDRIQGDKVVWMILTILILFSIVSIFSSTSLLTTSKLTRMDIFKDQLIIVGVGLVIIFVLYKIKYIIIFRVLSQLGYALSIALLLCLLFDIGAVERNGVKRALDLGFFEMHVFEVVKVAMVMYLAWAVNAFNTDSFWVVGKLSKKFKSLRFLAKKSWKLWIYIFIPILSVCLLIFPGSGSSSLFTGLIMILTILVGGISVKEILKLVPLMLVALTLCVGVWAVSGGKLFSRVGTMASRVGLAGMVESVTGKPVVSVKTYDMQSIKQLNPKSQEFRNAMDVLRQPESAKIAIHEGGILGKGPGNSTQKYAVSLMFSDYMYSFIAEEYGLWGAILIIVVYISLLARGSLIVRYCDSDFSKTAVGGLSLLITGQAMLHILINLDMGLLSGQTLPMISHGKSSFICFSIAFGVILSISKMAKKQIQEETEASEPLAEGMGVDEEVADTLNDLDDFESGRI